MFPTSHNGGVTVRRRRTKFYLLFHLFFLICCQLNCDAARRSTAFIGNERRLARKSGLVGEQSAKQLSSPFPARKCRIPQRLFAESTSHETLNECFPDHLIRSLDLVPLMHGVASHAGTRRGYQAILALVKEDRKTIQKKLLFNSGGRGISSRLRRAMVATTSDLSVSQTRNQHRKKNRTRILLAPIATSAHEARQEYEVVEEATLALQENEHNLTFPPFYGAESSPWDTSTNPITDDDEWLTLAADSWTLEYIIQAEQVIKKLIEVKNWSSLEEIKTWMPILSKIGLLVDEDDLLPSVCSDIAGTVEIARVRSLTDPTGKATFTFRLKGERFPVLKLLRAKEEKLLENGGKAMDRAIIAIQNEIDEVQAQIQAGLAQSVLSVSGAIDEGLDVLARLDIVFAKAAYGLRLDGVIPLVANEGRISVDGFVHPVLATNDGFSSHAGPDESGHIVPIDLRLSSEDGDRALLISGPNGGGKTLTMKSFGLVGILNKLGLPISLRHHDQGKPRVDFFDHILVNVGDQQSAVDGESTWTAILNSCASIIERVAGGATDDTAKSHDNYLVLLDELGSGTDPEAGGAIAQAILEQLLVVPTCHIVATTHSPRLKTLSYESPQFGCATVLLENDDSREYKRPSFRLEYGLIGESYALGAASRCIPALPDSVLTRASQLMTQGSEQDGTQSGTSSDYIRALTNSMEDQVERARNERIAMEKSARDSAKCRVAMMSLAASYENHLTRLEQRLDDCYQKLLKDEDDLELIGGTISELRVVKKQILSQKELLKERGLKLLPTSYKLLAGFSAVIVAEGEWDGATVQVVADCSTDETLGPTEVLVQPSPSFLAWDNMFSNDGPPNDAMVDRPLIVQRHELAIWDYDSAWEEDTDMTFTATSVPDSKRRLNSLLSTLKTDYVPKKDSSSGNTVKKSFTSAGARKAANKGKGKKKRK